MRNPLLNLHTIIRQNKANGEDRIYTAGMPGGELECYSAGSHGDNWPNNEDWHCR